MIDPACAARLELVEDRGEPAEQHLQPQRGLEIVGVGRELRIGAHGVPEVGGRAVAAEETAQECLLDVGRGDRATERVADERRAGRRERVRYGGVLHG